MSTTVVTGWSPAGWREYGQKFVQSFCAYWPREVRLISYVEETIEVPSRVELRDLSSIPGCYDFIGRWRKSPLACGREVRPEWKDSAKLAGYNFRFDAVKFCRQGFIPYHAMGELNAGDVMCWLDADVVTYRPIPEGFIESLIPHDRCVSYLGRAPKHSEIGFQGYRVSAGASTLTHAFSQMYATDQVFQLKEWHSAFVFDHCLETCKVPSHNLTPNGTGHVWFQSPLGQYTDHLKGKRKRRGASEERRRA